MKLTDNVEFLFVLVIFVQKINTFTKIGLEIFFIYAYCFSIHTFMMKPDVIKLEGVYSE
jgi:hypothetical protein